MTDNWGIIRKQHNPMIISTIIRTKEVVLKSKYNLKARGKREIVTDTKQPRKCELSNNNTKRKFTKTGTSLGLKLKPIVSNT